MNHNNMEFDITKIDLGLTPKAKSIISMLDEGIFIIEKYTNSIAQYDQFIQSMFDNMFEGFEHKEFREHPVQFKFTDDPAEEVKWLQYRHFVINIMLWRPQVCIDPSQFEVMGDSLIVDKTKMVKLSRSFIKNYVDDLYLARYAKYVNNHEMNAIICDMVFWLSRISAGFNPILGLGASIETFMDLANRIPEFQDLLYFKLDESKQPNEMEAEIKQKTREQIDIILNDEQFNILKPMLQPGAGIKPKQFSEFTLNIGPKPDIEGKTIPKPINVNYLIDGLNTIENQYKNSIAGRKAAIMNNEYMGKSGYMAILVSIACAQVVLSKTVVDCDTVNPIPIYISSKDDLKKVEGRRFKFHGERGYSIINSKTDEYLIGQTILMRSPITCSAKDGVCRECYGELFFTNKDIHSVGIFSATEVMNPVMQGILSAKHHQETISNPIKFQPMFDKFLDLYATDIGLNPDDDIDLSKHQLVIYIDDITSADGIDDIELKSNGTNKKKKKDVDDDSSELETSLPYSTKRFEIWEMKDTAGLKSSRIKNRMEFEDEEKKDLFMHNDLINKMEEGEDERGKYRYIPLEHINSEEFIFMVDIRNHELTIPLKAITRLLDNVDHEGCSDYESMVQTMLNLINESGISAMLLHGELIIRQLIRRKDNVLKRPNFSRVITRKDYDILTVKTSLRKNPSITTSLSTNYLKKQLIEQNETFMKVATSVFDPLYRRDLSYLSSEE